MREILFRGKAKNRFRSPWVEGYFMDIIGDGTPYIATITPTNDKEAIIDGEIVIPETIGQYTGLTDKNGKKIFEGDILKPYEDEIIYVAWIECFSTLGLMVHTTIEKKKYGKVVSKFVQEGFNFLCDYKLDELEVIGNIHDNPELLKGE